MTTRSTCFCYFVFGEKYHLWKKLKNQEAELHLIDILFVLKFCSHSKQIFWLNSDRTNDFCWLWPKFKLFQSHRSQTKNSRRVLKSSGKIWPWSKLSSHRKTRKREFDSKCRWNQSVWISIRHGKIWKKQSKALLLLVTYQGQFGMTDFQVLIYFLCDVFSQIAIFIFWNIFSDVYSLCVAYPEPLADKLYSETKKFLEEHVAATLVKVRSGGEQNLLGNYHDAWEEFSVINILIFTSNKKFSFYVKKKFTTFNLFF